LIKIGLKTGFLLTKMANLKNLHRKINEQKNQQLITGQNFMQGSQYDRMGDMSSETDWSDDFQERPPWWVPIM
jgi:hypothetical protein